MLGILPFCKFAKPITVFIKFDRRSNISWKTNSTNKRKRIPISIETKCIMKWYALQHHHLNYTYFKYIYIKDTHYNWYSSSFFYNFFFFLHLFDIYIYILKKKKLLKKEERSLNQWISLDYIFETNCNPGMMLYANHFKYIMSLWFIITNFPLVLSLSFLTLILLIFNYNQYLYESADISFQVVHTLPFAKN